MAYLIQGLFFQNHEWLGLCVRPIDGVIAVVRSELCQFMYAGSIWQDENHVLGALTGQMQDALGISDLSGIHIDNQTLRFTKKYRHRPDTTEYVFNRKDGESWVGEYRGVAVGNGVSRCLLTEVDDEFFDPTPIMSLLGKTVAHVWPERSKPVIPASEPFYCDICGSVMVRAGTCFKCLNCGNTAGCS